MDEELSAPDYLRNLADRLWKIPVVFGTDQYDCDRLREIADHMEDVDSVIEPDEA